MFGRGSQQPPVDYSFAILQLESRMQALENKCVGKMHLQRLDEEGTPLRYVEEGKYYAHSGFTGASYIVPDTGDAALSAVVAALLEHLGLEAVLEVPLAGNGLQWGLRSGPNEIVRIRKLPKVKAP